MSVELTLRYAVASCWHRWYIKAGPPRVPKGPVTLAQLRRLARPAKDLSLWPLEHRCRSRNLQGAALWVVLDLEGGRVARPSGQVRFDKATAIYAGPSHKACSWLLKHGLPVPADDVNVVCGVNTEHVQIAHGVAVGAHFGSATVESGLATTFLGNATARAAGVAVATEGHAQAGDHGLAICRSLFNIAQAGDGGTAWSDEFCRSIAGDSGIAISGVDGESIAGKAGIAITRGCGTVQAGVGGVLIVRCDRDTCVVGVVGAGGIKPDTPYKAQHGKLVQVERLLKMQLPERKKKGRSGMKP